MPRYPAVPGRYERLPAGCHVDAIICVYHGVNHLLGFAAWEGFFDCAYQHLNDGGVAIFDIYMTSYLQRMTLWKYCSNLTITSCG